MADHNAAVAAARREGEAVAQRAQQQVVALWRPLRIVSCKKPACATHKLLALAGCNSARDPIWAHLTHGPVCGGCSLKMGANA